MSESPHNERRREGEHSSSMPRNGGDRHSSEGRGRSRSPRGDRASPDKRDKDPESFT